MPSLNELAESRDDINELIYDKLLNIALTAKALNERLIKDGLDHFSVKAEALRRILGDELEDLEES